MRCPAAIWRTMGRTDVGRTVCGEDLGRDCECNQQHGNLVNRLHVERVVNILENEARECKR